MYEHTWEDLDTRQALGTHVVRLKETQSPAVYNYIIICIFKFHVLPQLVSLPLVNNGNFLFLEQVSSTRKDLDYSWVYFKKNRTVIWGSSKSDLTTSLSFKENQILSMVLRGRSHPKPPNHHYLLPPNLPLFSAKWFPGLTQHTASVHSQARMRHLAPASMPGLALTSWQSS